MTRSGTRPAPQLDLGDLHDLVSRSGPFVSVYLPLDHAVEDAPRQNELRWRALRREVEDDASPSALEAIDRLVADAHRLASDELAVLATGDDVVIIEGIEGSRATKGTALVGATPRLVPLVASRQRAVPYVVALVDRRGADLIAVPRGGRVELEEVALSDAASERKLRMRGRQQARAESGWEEGAEAIAAEVQALAERTGARLLVIGGDDRNSNALHDALPGDTFEIVRHTGESRAAGSEGDLHDELRRLVHDVAARDSVAVLEKLREELGQEDRAVEGADDTIAALARGQVDLLLVHDDADDDRSAWFGEAFGALTRHRTELQEIGVDEPHEARLVDALVREALLTGAGVRVVPRAGGPAEGIGALLRWA
jgi:hypothetical protein